MNDNDENPRTNPMQHPDEQAAGAEGSPRFGRLLLVLVGAVLVVIAVTFASEAFYS